MKKLAIFAISLTLLNCDPVANNPQLKLDYYTVYSSAEGQELNPELKVQYDYSPNGLLTSYAIYGFNANTQQLEKQRQFNFTYSSFGVDQIKGYLVNTLEPYVIYTYEYLEKDKVSKINEQNLSAGVTSQATFTYTLDTVYVDYDFSNGNSFEYRFYYGLSNIEHFKTLRGSELCDKGNYTYDNHPNPQNMLGFTDYLLLNISANNKVTEDVNYIACSFPSLVPESYEHLYNDKGYPIQSTTHYQNTGSTPFVSVKRYFYKEI